MFPFAKYFLKTLNIASSKTFSYTCVVRWKGFEKKRDLAYNNMKLKAVFADLYVLTDHKRDKPEDKPGTCYLHQDYIRFGRFSFI